jgi:hypothetical protein
VSALDQADEGPHPSSRSSVAVIGSWHLTDRPLETRGKKPLGPGLPRACLVSSVSLRALGYSSPTAGARTWLSASGNSRAMGRCAPGSRLRRQCCAKRMRRFSFGDRWAAEGMHAMRRAICCETFTCDQTHPMGYYPRVAPLGEYPCNLYIIQCSPAIKTYRCHLSLSISLPLSILQHVISTAL